MSVFRCMMCGDLKDFEKDHRVYNEELLYCPKCYSIRLDIDKRQCASIGKIKTEKYKPGASKKKDKIVKFDKDDD